jgi:uncharacterized membrane protein YidH (DUF202 family)
MRGFSIGITNEKDLWYMPLRWTQLMWYICAQFYDDRFRNSSSIKGIASTIWVSVLLVLLMIDDLRWQDIHTKSYDDLFRNSSRIKSLASTIWEAVLLVLLMTDDLLRWQDIHTKSHDDRFRHSNNIKSITSTINEAIMLVMLMRGVYALFHWVGFTWQDTLTKLHEDQ